MSGENKGILRFRSALDKLLKFPPVHFIVNGCVAADSNKVNMLGSICKTPLVIGEHLRYRTKGNQTAPNMFKMPVLCQLFVLTTLLPDPNRDRDSEGQQKAR